MTDFELDWVWVRGINKAGFLTCLEFHFPESSIESILDFFFWICDVTIYDWKLGRIIEFYFRNLEQPSILAQLFGARYWLIWNIPRNCVTTPTPAGQFASVLKCDLNSQTWDVKHLYCNLIGQNSMRSWTDRKSAKFCSWTIKSNS